MKFGSVPVADALDATAVHSIRQGDFVLKKGTRIVCHDFEFSKWTPVKVVDIDDDGEGRSHTLFLYVR